MNLKNIIWKAVLALTILPCCIACNDEEGMVVPSKYYIGTEVDPSDAYIVSLMVNKVDNVVTGAVQPKYSFIVRSTMPVSTDVQIGITPDEALVADYNKANGSTYLLLPAENYTLTGKAIIKTGAFASTDSISVALKNSNALTNGDGYLLPLRMSSVEGGNGGLISSNRSIVYLKVNVALSYPGNLLFKGTEPLSGLTDIKRTEFEINCAAPAYEESYSIGYLLDGNSSSCYFCSTGGSAPIEIDMHTVYTPKGIAITAGYGKFAYSNYALKKFQVLVSKDGKKWISYGETTIDQPIKNASSSAKPLVQYIEFKKAEAVRYVQVKPLSAYGNYVNLSEINLFE